MSTPIQTPSAPQVTSDATKPEGLTIEQQQVKDKLDHGIAPTKEEAKIVESQEHRALGHLPEKGTLSAQAQSAADKAAAGVHQTAQVATAQTHTAGDKTVNGQDIKQHVENKLASGVAPTQEEAKLAESHEHRALGHLPRPGSTAAIAQSVAEKKANHDEIATKVQEKLHNDPASVTSAEARTLESREHKLEGHCPGADSLAAEAKRVASANEAGLSLRSAPTGGQTDGTKEVEFEEAKKIVEPKVVSDPAHVTQEDASLMHSADRRAHGVVTDEVTSKAQHLVDENKKADTA